MEWAIVENTHDANREAMLMDLMQVRITEYKFSIIKPMHITYMYLLKKRGSLGPWSRVMVCCSKSFFFKNDPPHCIGGHFGKRIACYNKP